jgi:hypothetical protein
MGDLPIVPVSLTRRSVDGAIAQMGRIDRRFMLSGRHNWPNTLHQPPNPASSAPGNADLGRSSKQSAGLRGGKVNGARTYGSQCSPGHP